MKELSILKAHGKMSLNPSGKVRLSRLVNTGEIKTKKEFEELFPVIAGNQEKINRRMEERGYDESQPLHVWEGEGGTVVLIDGHHRLRAARKAGITEVPCYFHHFEDTEEALEYAIAIQVERRNLRDAELMIMLKVVDKLKERGKGPCGERGKSAKRTAEILGTNTSKVEKARMVEKYGSEELKEKVASGEISLNQAYMEARAEKEGTEPNEGAAGNGVGKTAAAGTGEGEAYTGDTGNPTRKFLKAAVEILAVKGEGKAAGILVNHFLRKKEREPFYAQLSAREAGGGGEDDGEK
jgi:ParB family chromosome partitioning protein